MTRDRFQLSCWDAAILVACRSLGCDVVLSEDLGEGRTTAACGWRTRFAAHELGSDADDKMADWFDGERERRYGVLPDGSRGRLT